MRNGDMGSELWLYKEDIGKKMGWRKEMEVEEIDPRHVVGFFKGFYDVMIYSFQQSWILGMLNIDWQVGTHQFFPFRSDLEPVDLGRG
ncbi:hypothetical protein CASFOL_036672 [Castilleja foliolosa]|uniref:Uncharacterized protein n=1 Tax=Castilleja foliolosa TaxID=1961234 RepID=A0ABD3BP90_9LAMI